MGKNEGRRMIDTDKYEELIDGNLDTYECVFIAKELIAEVERLREGIKQLIMKVEGMSTGYRKPIVKALKELIE